MPALLTGITAIAFPAFLMYQEQVAGEVTVFHCLLIALLLTAQLLVCACVASGLISLSQ